MANIEKIAAQVKQAILDRNIVTISEFSQFAALFDNSIRTSGMMDNEELSELCNRYYERFSQHHPIVIVTDDKREVIQVRPPAMIQMPTFNETIKQADTLIDTYVNVTTSESQPAHKKIQVANTLEKAFGLTKKSSKFQKRADAAIELERKYNEGTSATKKKDKASDKGSTKGMAWE